MLKRMPFDGRGRKAAVKNGSEVLTLHYNEIYDVWCFGSRRRDYCATASRFTVNSAAEH